MEKKIIFCVLFLSLLLTSLSVAQLKKPESNIIKSSSLTDKPKGFLNALLDPSRFSMSHSYSVSMFSVGKQTFNQGLYLNTMNYKFSEPLTMQVRIGFIHQPLGSMGLTNNPNQNQNGRLFLQRARLQYKPSENMSFTIDYQVLPSSMYYSPYYHRRWY